MTELDDLAEAIGRLLVERGETVAVAESSAVGRLSASLLGVAGASAFFKGGVVVYNAAAKERLAGMTAEQLEAHRSSTAPPYGAAGAIDPRTAWGELGHRRDRRGRANRQSVRRRSRPCGARSGG